MEKDRPLFRFLWKWKIATSSAIGIRFYGDRKYPGFTAYQRLLKLKKRGFVKYAFVQDDPSARAWTLTKKGLKTIVPSLGLLKEEGSGSENIHHDLWVQAAHLGENLDRDDENIDQFTEQELRRLDMSAYPDWVPQKKLHRPDGYWRVSIGEQKKIVALEVELSRKTSSDYRFVSDYYARSGTISRVIWVVESASFVDRIRIALGSANPEKIGMHFFFLREGLRDNGWDCRCIRGENSGRKFREIMNFIEQNQLKTGSIPAPNQGFVAAILDTRVRRMNLDTSDKASNNSHLLLNAPHSSPIT
ncbi:MAG: hypothetical protein JST16_02780 [Bdellovibrionales bacterium]|nr:hypothetical protein [Bdellovibrionales bacterium]